MVESRDLGVLEPWEQRDRGQPLDSGQQERWKKMPSPQ